MVLSNDFASSIELASGFQPPCATVWRADSFTPNVGHRGGLPSVRSKIVTGKLDSIPPSVHRISPCPWVTSGLAFIWNGRKKNGIPAEDRTASATDWVSGSTPSRD